MPSLHMYFGFNKMYAIAFFLVVQHVFFPSKYTKTCISFPYQSTKEIYLTVKGGGECFKVLCCLFVSQTPKRC